jgi:hypothetical protein
MMMKLFASQNCRLVAACSILFLASLASCRKGISSSPVTTRPKIETCALITKDEVGTIEGSPIQDAKQSENSDGSFQVGQCFYNAETFNKSVSVAVTQADPASPKARSPKDFWKETFGRYEGKGKEEEGDEEKKKSLSEQEEEKGTPPKKIDGIGDAAYWTANRMGGALYVLKNDVFIRVSVGGPDSEEDKIKRCKALAEKALSRL